MLPNKLQIKSIILTMKYILGMHNYQQKIENIPQCILEAFLGHITNNKIINIMTFARLNDIPTNIIVEIIDRLNKIKKNRINPFTLKLINIIANKIDRKIIAQRTIMTANTQNHTGNSTIPPMRYISYDLELKRYLSLSGKLIDANAAHEIMKRKPRQRTKRNHKNIKNKKYF